MVSMFVLRETGSGFRKTGRCVRRVCGTDDIFRVGHLFVFCTGVVIHPSSVDSFSSNSRTEITVKRRTITNPGEAAPWISADNGDPDQFTKIAVRCLLILSLSVQRRETF